MNNNNVKQMTLKEIEAELTAMCDATIVKDGKAFYSEAETERRFELFTQRDRLQKRLKNKVVK